MATKTCKNGHAYDASIYGQNCPFCPQEDSTERTKVNSGNGFEDPTLPNSSWGQNNPTDPTKPTVPMNDENDNDGQRTRIRILGGEGQTGINDFGGGFLVGLLISYSHNPQGEVYKIYEGANLIGRGGNSTIKVLNDNTMSREHLMIQYISATGQFAAQDKGSSGGTYINGKAYNILTPIELKNNDIIVLGRTKFVFLAIPPLYLNQNENGTKH